MVDMNEADALRETFANGCVDFFAERGVSVSNSWINYSPFNGSPMLMFSVHDSDGDGGRIKITFKLKRDSECKLYARPYLIAAEQSSGKFAEVAEQLSDAMADQGFVEVA